MIFDANRCCAPAELREEQGAAPALLGAGLWVGLLSAGHCTLRGGGGAAARGQAGDLLLGCGPLTLTPAEPCHLLAVCLTGLCAEEFARALPAPRFAPADACPAAAELIARLCDGSRTGAAASQTAYSLLCELAHADESAPALPPLVAAAVQAIRDNYMGLYGVEELSRQLGVSKCHLVRAFTAAMGVSPGQFLTRTRLEAARLLLLERDYSLELIANLCGFSGANYFCRVFKKETGSTPAAWRESELPRAAQRAPLPHENEFYV